MKTNTINTLFVFFAIVASIAATPSAFAAETASVSAPAGTSVPGCEETNECFVPSEVTIDVGGEVTWSNDDSAAHTVTSGSAADGPDGVFDSSLFMAGTTFSATIDEAGTYPYFCMVHPWMVGTVIVQEAGAEEEMMAEETMEEEMMAEDLTVVITDSASDDGIEVTLQFNQMHANYEITATQGGEEVLKEAGHAHEDMMGTHQISAVASDDNPIDISVVSLGVGLPGEEATWSGPLGEIQTAQVVPEFGTIAVMILGVAIVSIIAFSARSKLMLPKL